MSNFKTVYLISEGVFKTVVPVDDNLNFPQLLPIVRMVQDKALMPILGSAFLDEIKTQVDEDSLSSDNENLLVNFIIPFLCWSVAYEFLLSWGNQIVNKGIITGTNASQMGSSTSAEVVNNMQSSFLNNANFYQTLLVSQLIENDSLYPLYRNPPVGSLVLPQKKKSTSQFYAPHRPSLINTQNYSSVYRKGSWGLVNLDPPQSN